MVASPARVLRARRLGLGWAAQYPTGKNVTFLANFPPGGLVDIGHAGVRRRGG